MTEHSIYKKFELDDQAIKTYSTFPRFTIREAAAVMLNLNPYYCGYHEVETERNFAALVSAIDTAAIHNAFTTAEFEYDINGNKWATSISNDELREWAIFYGYDWKLKTFTPFKSKTAINEPKESENLSKPDIEKDEIIGNLRARNAELEKQPQKQSAINYDEFSIYGHTSENLEIIFKIAKKIADECDPDNFHSYPTKEQISEYVKRYFSDNDKLCESVYQIIIPDKVKTRGKPPKGVDTFKGFI